MAGKRSVVWQFFTAVEDMKAKCDLCKTIISHKSTVTNLKSHLSRKHPTIILPNPKMTTQPIRSATSTATGDRDRELHPSTSRSTVSIKPVQPAEIFLRRNPLVGTSTDVLNLEQVEAVELPHEETVEAENRLTHQSSLHSYIPVRISADKKKKIDVALLQLFIKDFQPFSIVNDKGFVAFLKELNPGYEVPSRKMISQSLIPAAYERCVNNAKEIAKKIRKLCITTDLWTSLNNDSYMAVTGHFITDNFLLKSILLECSMITQSHTSVNLTASLSRIIREWDLQGKIILAVSDNAPNIVNAIKDGLKLKHFGCFAHTVNLVVENGIKTSVLVEILNKIKSIVGHFRRSVQAKEKLFAYQRNNGSSSPKKLIISVQTRWNSTFYMLERFLELEDAIRSTVALLDTELPSIEQRDWLVMRDLLKALKPFEAVTKIVSGEKHITASLVIVLSNGLIDQCKEALKRHNHPEIKRFLENVQADLQRRIGNVELSRTLGIATYLDPRFKNVAFQTPDAEKLVKEKVLQLIGEMVQISPHERPSTSQELETESYSPFNLFERSAKAYKPTGTRHSRALIEMQRYLEEELIGRERNPLDWWRENAFQFPYLSKIAQEHLCALATSVPCERLFSKAGIILNDRRTRLSPVKLKQLLTLHVNSELLQD